MRSFKGMTLCEKLFACGQMSGWYVSFGGWVIKVAWRGSNSKSG